MMPANSWKKTIHPLRSTRGSTQDCAINPLIHKNKFKKKWFNTQDINATNISEPCTSFKKNRYIQSLQTDTVTRT
jgi:hypothetical protein